MMVLTQNVINDFDVNREHGIILLTCSSDRACGCFMEPCCNSISIYELFKFALIIMSLACSKILYLVSGYMLPLQGIVD